MKILIVEDEDINVKVLRFHIETFIKSQRIENVMIDIASNGLEALGYLSIKEYDVMFLDVRMPKFDGIKVLNTLKMRDSKLPHICMVTALGEEKYKRLFKLLHANSYIIKPFEDEKIYAVLQKVYDKNLKEIPTQTIQEEEIVFENDFFDFDDEEPQVQTAIYETVSAQEFVKDYENLEYILEDLEEIDSLLDEIIHSLDIDTLNPLKANIELTLNKYITFLHSLMEFNALSEALSIMVREVQQLNLEKFEDMKKVFIIELIRAILEDISSWKEFVFVSQEAQNVHYINDSVLSNCDQFVKVVNE